MDDQVGFFLAGYPDAIVDLAHQLRAIVPAAALIELTREGARVAEMTAAERLARVLPPGAGRAPG